MIVLTNGRVAWSLFGYIGDRYHDKVYLPPEGWQIKFLLLDAVHCQREVCGNYRFKEGHTFIVEVDHDM